MWFCWGGLCCLVWVWLLLCCLLICVAFVLGLVGVDLSCFDALVVGLVWFVWRLCGLFGVICFILIVLLALILLI